MADDDMVTKCLPLLDPSNEGVVWGDRGVQVHRDGTLGRFEAGLLDLIIGATRQLRTDSSLQTEDLFEDELSVICGASHPLASRNRLSVTEILDYG
jgi:DNA-binding transcriptional LysR family regulator